MILRKKTVPTWRWIALIALSILLWLSTLVSCSSDEQDSPYKTAVPVQFLSELLSPQGNLGGAPRSPQGNLGGASRSPQGNLAAPPRGPRSRASDDSWDKDDQVGIYMTPHDVDGDGTQAIDVANAIKENVPYKASESSTSSALVPVDGSIFFPQDGSSVNFMAYYPYNSGVHSTHNHIYPVNVATQDPLAAIDLLYHSSTTAYDADDSKNGVPLVFSHQLSKLSISVVDASGANVDLSTATASLVGVPTTAGFNLATGVLNNAGGTGTAIAPVKNTALSSTSQALFESIFVPHDEVATKRTITITIDGTAYSYPLPAERSFLSGTAYSYNFKFIGSGLVLTQATVVDWDSGIIFWGERQLTTTKTYFDLPFTASVATANTVTFSTTAPSAPALLLSNASGSVTTDKPTWITDATLASTDEADGWKSYTLTFGTNIHIGSASRTGYIHIVIEGLTLAVRVTQANAALYVDDPVPASFTDLDADAATGKSFTFETNSTSSSLTSLTTTNSTMLTDLSAERTDKDATNGIYIWTVTFNVSKNSDSNARSGNISIAIGGITKTVSVSQVAGVPPVTEQPSTAVADGMTNCYIVNTSSSVAFKVSRAYTYSGSAFTNTLHVGGTYTDGFVCKTIWDDNSVLSGTTSGSDILHTVDGSGNQAIVTINTSGRQGNAVVGLYKKDGKTLLWSYHIWVLTNYNPATKTFTNNGFRFMDRNLGATAAANSLAGRGLFYQWGRKDPFPGGASGTAGYNALSKFTGLGSAAAMSGASTAAAGVLKGIQNPTVFYCYYNTTHYDWLPVQDNTLWNTSGNQKSIYDPCPSGWRVPTSGTGSTSPWYGLAKQTFTGGNSGGYSWSMTGGTTYYPAAGLRNRNNGSFGPGGSYGYYWSGSVNGVTGYSLLFYSGTVTPSSIGNRSYGFSVRCVSEPV